MGKKAYSAYLQLSMASTFFFEDWKVSNNRSPNNAIINFSITMNDMIAHTNNFLFTCNLNVRVKFINAIHCFANIFKFFSTGES